MLQTMSRYWWISLVRGIAAVLFGIAIFLSPGIALTVLVLLWGAYAFTDGIFAIIAGFQGRQSHNNWWLTVLEGVIGVVAGGRERIRGEERARARARGPALSPLRLDGPACGGRVGVGFASGLGWERRGRIAGRIRETG